MTDNNSARRDYSRFQLKSYGWRGVDISSDAAIQLMEQAFQSAMAIEGISRELREKVCIEGPDAQPLNYPQIDNFLGAIEQLSGNLVNQLCSYASSIEDKIEATRKEVTA